MEHLVDGEDGGGGCRPSGSKSVPRIRCLTSLCLISSSVNEAKRGVHLMELQ